MHDVASAIRLLGLTASGQPVDTEALSNVLGAIESGVTASATATGATETPGAAQALMTCH
ncbi:MAG: hypothetical protein HYV20_04345 [Gemmatimonadetes bacterium]|nr:hypothetical protein [Gemmatimonadota bacterium]